MGFSLVEMMVAVAITAVLIALGVGATRVALERAASTSEINAARTLISAYQLHASEHNGALMPGYDRRVDYLELPDGTVVQSPPSNRYPFRLAPWFNYKIEGVTLVNRNRRQIDEANYIYWASTYPAFGMNHIFVGGNIDSNGNYTFSSDCARRMAEVEKPSSLLVFASAMGGFAPHDGAAAGGSRINGYSMLIAPRQTGPMWVGETDLNNPRADAYGHVDPRHGGKAICAFLDGSVRSHTIDELRDMRLWSFRAAQENNPNYSVSSQTGGGRR